MNNNYAQQDKYLLLKWTIIIMKMIKKINNYDQDKQ